MKIEYLKVMHDANVGDVKEVEDFAANVLIKTGVAKAVKPSKKPAQKPAEDSDQQE
ncbi:hypothetical protein [Acinetobacter sp. ANC 4640]